jgi:type IX secretion system PorP/SprF family membrane protein
MRKILLVLILFKAGMAMSQQEAPYTHYMYNIMAVNPAYAGYENLLTATILHRSQWVKFPGEPILQTFFIQSPVGKNVGAGLSFVNNQAGLERNIALKAFYSYTIRSEEKLKISFGLKAGLNMLQIGLTDAKLDDPGDTDFVNNIASTFLPNFGFGVFAYTETYYFGLSVPDLIQHDYLNNTIFSSSSLALDKKKYYFIGGASFPIGNRVFFNPSSFISLSKKKDGNQGLSLIADFSTMFIIDNKYAGGIMIRSENAIAFLIGMMLTPELEFGYSFDLLHSIPTARYNGGSHEIVLKYNFKKRFKNRNGRLPCSTFQIIE